MAVKVECPKCNEILRLANDRAGERVTCPGCRCLFMVPDSDPPLSKSSRTAETNDRRSRREPRPAECDDGPAFRPRKKKKRGSGAGAAIWIVVAVLGVLLAGGAGVGAYFLFRDKGNDTADNDDDKEKPKAANTQPGTKPRPGPGPAPGPGPGPGPLPGVGLKARDIIVGKWRWQSPRGEVTSEAEYFANGTYTGSALSIRVSGTYRFIDDNTIKTTATVDGKELTATVKLRVISRDEIQTFQEGQTFTFRRVGTAPAPVR